MGHETLDILKWPDDYWCFRVEFVQLSLLDDDAREYREIPFGTPEWTLLVRTSNALSEAPQAC